MTIIKNEEYFNIIYIIFLQYYISKRSKRFFFYLFNILALQLDSRHVFYSYTQVIGTIIGFYYCFYSIKWLYDFGFYFSSILFILVDYTTHASIHFDLIERIIVECRLKELYRQQTFEIILILLPQLCVFYFWPVSHFSIVCM